MAQKRCAAIAIRMVICAFLLGWDADGMDDIGSDPGRGLQVVALSQTVWHCILHFSARVVATIVALHGS